MQGQRNVGQEYPAEHTENVKGLVVVQPKGFSLESSAGSSTQLFPGIILHVKPLRCQVDTMCSKHLRPWLLRKQSRL